MGPTWVSRVSAHLGHLGTGVIEAPSQNQLPQLPRQGRRVAWHTAPQACLSFWGPPLTSEEAGREFTEEESWELLGSTDHHQAEEGEEWLAEPKAAERWSNVRAEKWR